MLSWQVSHLNIVTALSRHMSMKTSLLCSFIITLITRVFDTYMFRSVVCQHMKSMSRRAVRTKAWTGAT